MASKGRLSFFHEFSEYCFCPVGNLPPTFVYLDCFRVLKPLSALDVCECIAPDSRILYFDHGASVVSVTISVSDTSYCDLF